MSTGITRGPKICPSCGQENPPTAARCWLCFTPLGGAFQTAPAPAQGEIRIRPLRAELTGPTRSGCATAAAWIGVAVLTIISAGVTFVAVCFPIGLANIDNTDFDYPGGNPHTDYSLTILGWVLGLVAAGIVATLIIVAFVRRQRR
jgi:hypothetical protein